MFITNYLNHHQLPLCDGLLKRLQSGFRFVATEPLDQERRRLGYSDINCEYDFVVRSYESLSQESVAFRHVNEAEVVLVGSAPEKYAAQRVSRRKLLFRYSERPLKKGFELKKYPLRFLKWRFRNRGRNVYLLSASAFAPLDYRKFGLFKNKSFKWGYFPETKKYENVSGMLEKKSSHTIVWAGRFLDWKHPDDVLLLSKKLKDEGKDFLVKMIGIGPMLPEIEKMRDVLGLTDCVQLVGSISPGEVRSYMESSGIFVFTSDRREGWGAVLNEAMNSGCAVVASHLIGSVPYLIENERNGYVYRYGDFDEFYLRVKTLLDSPEKQRQFGLAAYETIETLWNSEVAANRLVELSEHILSNRDVSGLYVDGPCSVAGLIGEDWYKGESAND